MIGPDRRHVVLALAALAGCGFTPAYGPGGPAAGLRGEIVADAPADRAGYVLVRRLEERLGPPEAPRYRLAADIRLSQEGAGITPGGVTTRYILRGRVDWRLIDLATGTVLRQGRAASNTGYAATAPIVATGVARDDASDRLMVILADRIVADLVATAAEWRGGG